MGHTHRLFGLTFSSPAPLPAPLAVGTPDVEIIDRGLASTPIVGTEQLTYAVQPDGTAVATWLDRIQFSVPASGNRIEFTYATPADAALIFDYLLSQAASVVLLQRGIEPLHGAAVAINDRAVAFIGDCGSGKSTLAAAMLKRGARLLTDDLLVISPATGLAESGPQRIKLTHEIAARTIGERPAVRLPDARAKSSYPLHAAEHCAQPRQLQHVFVIRSTHGEFRIEALAPLEALRELLAATFNPLEQRRERLERHLEFATELARSVPMAALQLPWDLARLDRTAAALAELEV